MTKKNVLFILLVMISLGVFAQNNEPLAPKQKFETSQLVCEFPKGDPFWTEDREVYNAQSNNPWPKNKPYDQLRVFKLPIEPRSIVKTDVYYLAQTTSLANIISTNYKPVDYHYIFISDFTSYDQGRLAEYVEKNCNVALDFELTKKRLEAFKALAGKQINATQRMPLDLDRMFESMHDTATTTETASK